MSRVSRFSRMVLNLMWRVLYNCLLIVVSPIVLCILLMKPRCRRGLPQRLGWREGSCGLSRLFSFFGFFERNKPDQPDKPNEPERPDKPLIWVHAVSLGEATAAVPLVAALQQRHPEYRYLVTTVTETGREAVEQRLAGIAEHRYAPLDFPWVVSAMVKHVRPALYIFVETELWPNLLWTMQARQVPTVLVNGRFSSRSFQRQDIAVIRSFYRSVLRSVTLCLMQSDRDRQRIVALGADPAHVHITGNIKFDQPLPGQQDDTLLRQSLGVGADEQLLLAGCTHPGEEELLVSAFRQIVTAHPSAVLMLAPRHIERAPRVETMVREAGFSVYRKSLIRDGAKGPRVIILDSRGELARAYREATVAFVGGTLIPVGGHNLLEPAVWGKPVLFGPYTDHCAEVASLLLDAGGGSRVAGGHDIVRQVNAWLADQDACSKAGQAARRVVVENQGALKRSLELIESCLARAPVSVNPSIDSATGPSMVRP